MAKNGSACELPASGARTIALALGVRAATMQGVVMTRYLVGLDARSVFQADHSLLCADMFRAFSTHGSRGGVCGQGFKLWSKRRARPVLLGKASVSCRGKHDAHALLKMCSSTCMAQRHSKACCWLPHSLAGPFRCCGRLGCCSARDTGGHRRLGAGASAATNVEGDTASAARYKVLVACLSKLRPSSDATGCARAARCHRSAKCTKCMAMTKSAKTCESWNIRCSCHGATTAAPRQGESSHRSRLRII